MVYEYCLSVCCVCICAWVIVCIVKIMKTTEYCGLSEYVLFVSFLCHSSVCEYCLCVVNTCVYLSMNEKMNVHMHFSYFFDWGEKRKIPLSENNTNNNCRHTYCMYIYACMCSAKTKSETGRITTHTTKIHRRDTCARSKKGKTRRESMCGRVSSTVPLPSYFNWERREIFGFSGRFFEIFWRFSGREKSFVPAGVKPAPTVSEVSGQPLGQRRKNRFNEKFRFGLRCGNRVLGDLRHLGVSARLQKIL